MFVELINVASYGVVNGVACIPWRRCDQGQRKVLLTDPAKLNLYINGNIFTIMQTCNKSKYINQVHTCAADEFVSLISLTDLKVI